MSAISRQGFDYENHRGNHRDQFRPNSFFFSAARTSIGYPNCLAGNLFVFFFYFYFSIKQTTADIFTLCTLFIRFEFGAKLYIFPTNIRKRNRRYNLKQFVKSDAHAQYTDVWMQYITFVQLLFQLRQECYPTALFMNANVNSF